LGRFDASQDSRDFIPWIGLRGARKGLDSESTGSRGGAHKFPAGGVQGHKGTIFFRAAAVKQKSPKGPLSN
jgi:hypothetical protein